MATRIVVMAAKPGRVRRIIENPLPFPRDYRSPAVPAAGRRDPRGHHRERAPRRPPPGPSDAGTPKRPGWEPLPDASIVEIIGLLEVLDDRGGTEDVFDLVEDSGSEFGKVMAVVKAAELLDFVDTPKQDVVLAESGRAVPRQRACPSAR